MTERFYSRYLLEEHPITFHTTLAYALGLNEAIVLQKINLWLNCKPHNIDNRGWVYNSYKNWQQQLPFFSESTIKRTFNNLCEQGILLKGNFNKNKMDNTNWYSIDYEKLDEIVDIKRKELESNWNDDLVNLNQLDGQTEQTNTNEYYNDIKIDNLFNNKLSKKNDLSSNRTDVYLEQFEKFYQEYPRKAQKQNVKKWFLKHKPNDSLFEDIMKALKLFKQDKDWLKDNGQFIPYPATWLNQQRWEEKLDILEKENKKEQEQYKAYMGLENLTKEEYRQLENGEITVQELVEKGKLYYV